MKLTWQVYSQTGEVIWSISATHTPGTWWPTLTPDFCQLAAGLNSWDIPNRSYDQLSTYMTPRPPGWGMPGCATPTARCRLGQHDFYACPKEGRDRSQEKKCGGYETYFCSSWGCETTGDAYWKPSSSKEFITILKNFTSHGKSPSDCYRPPESYYRGGKSLPLQIQFTERGKKHLAPWLTGRTWGLRWFMTGGDLGIILKIRLSQTPIMMSPTGPNPVLGDQRAPSVPRQPESPPPRSTSIPNDTHHTPTTSLNIPPAPTLPGSGERLLDLIRG